ncbi:YheC/YheD family protein [Paenibacillus sp. GCM10027627]|uniref:YheC/YheD family protein n=1 Tax=unclassified Paenibacillus TaxID=185978 RepID=UPI00362E3AF1
MAKDYASRNIRGKLRVCRYLKGSSDLRQYVPDTVSFSRSNLEAMLGRYGILYVKPDVGSLGIGICKIKRTRSGYELKSIQGKQQTSTKLESAAALYDRIAAGSKGKNLIIQQGIKLDQVKGRPYDIRAMVQRKPGGGWTCTGFMVKAGAAGKIVTNYYQGGSIWTLRKLHDQLGLSESESAARSGKLGWVALKMAALLSAKRSGMREMGIDFAFDRDHRLWVLEVNSNHPQFHPLKTIDPGAYNTMKHFAASYGRKSAK